MVIFCARLRGLFKVPRLIQNCSSDIGLDQGRTQGPATLGTGPGSVMSEITVVKIVSVVVDPFR